MPSVLVTVITVDVKYPLKEFHMKIIQAFLLCGIDSPGFTYIQTGADYTSVVN